MGISQLSTQALDILERDENDIWVSRASLWEIAIKNALKRANQTAFGISVTDANREFDRASFRPLAISVAAIEHVEKLPSHHSDPFDRLLIAQARAESMHLLTHDKTLAAYGDVVIVI